MLAKGCRNYGSQADSDGGLRDTADGEKDGERDGEHSAAHPAPAPCPVPTSPPRHPGQKGGRRHTWMSSSGPSQSISQMTRTLHKQRHVGPNDNTEVGKANFILSHDHIYCAVYKWGAQNRNYLLEGGPLENRLPWLGECSRSPSVSVHQLVLL